MSLNDASSNHTILFTNSALSSTLFLWNCSRNCTLRLYSRHVTPWNEKFPHSSFQNAMYPCMLIPVWWPHRVRPIYYLAIVSIVATPHQSRQGTSTSLLVDAHIAPYLQTQIYGECVQFLLRLEALLYMHTATAFGLRTLRTNFLYSNVKRSAAILLCRL